MEIIDTKIKENKPNNARGIGMKNTCRETCPMHFAFDEQTQIATPDDIQTGTSTYIQPHDRTKSVERTERP